MTPIQVMKMHHWRAGNGDGLTPLGKSLSELSVKRKPSFFSFDFKVWLWSNELMPFVICSENNLIQKWDSAMLGKFRGNTRRQ